MLKGFSKRRGTSTSGCRPALYASLAAAHAVARHTALKSIDDFEARFPREVWGDNAAPFGLAVLDAGGTQCGDSTDLSSEESGEATYNCMQAYIHRHWISSALGAMLSRDY